MKQFVTLKWLIFKANLNLLERASKLNLSVVYLCQCSQKYLPLPAQNFFTSSKSSARSYFQSCL